LLNLSDDQLRLLLRRLLAENGVDPSTVPLDQVNMGALREALRNATDQDIAGYMGLFSALVNRGGASPQ
jgi:ABC-type nitrate/sulfonate/bicarbonate transport system substrate-binding protein